MAEATKLLRAIFDEASEIEIEGERQAYLEQACGNDAALRAKIERLLRSEARAGGFLADPKRHESAHAGIVEKEGDRIGRYKLLQKIGEGGCGIVYMAEQTEPVRRRVALKVIKLGMDTRSVVARFQAERQALAMMDHPSIAKIYDAGATDTGRPYFVMELVRGIKITDFCEQNNLSTEQRLELFIQVCQAVQHAHQKGIIHRDLKPSNVLVTSDDGVPLPRVIDFGIAKATADVQLTNKTLFTRFDMFIGTPAYMSPEQAEFNAHDVDTRTDIYSLGVLLYELLTGRPPFDTETWLKSGIDALRKAIREKEPTRPSTRLTMELAALGVPPSGGRAGKQAGDSRQNPAEPPKGGTPNRRPPTKELIAQLRGDLDWIVLKALEKDRARRYETANAFAADIQRHLRHEPVAARPPNPLYLFGKSVRRNRAAFAVSAAVALLLVSGIVFTLREAARTRAAEKVQRSLREQAEANQRQADAANQRLTRSLFIREWQDAEHLLEQGKVASALAWFARTVRSSPDDVAARTRLLAILTERSFALPARHPLVHGGPVNSASLTSDGTHLVTVAGDRRVRIWELASDAPPRMLPETFSDPRVAIVAPGNRLLVEDSESISLWEWNGTRVRTIPVPRHATGPIPTTPDGRFALLNGKDGAQLWDATELRPVGRPISVESPHGVSGNGQYLFGVTERRPAAWAVSSGTKIWEATVAELPLSGWMGMAFDLRNQRAVVNRWTGGATELSIWNLGPDGLPRSSFPSRTLWAGKVSTQAFSPSGDRLFVGSMEGSVGCVDLLARETQWEPLNCEHDGRINEMSCARDGHFLATASADGTARLWNVRMGSPEPRIFTNGASVWDAKFSPDSSWFVMTGVDAAEIRDTRIERRDRNLSFLPLSDQRHARLDHLAASGGEQIVSTAQAVAQVKEEKLPKPPYRKVLKSDDRQTSIHFQPRVHLDVNVPRLANHSLAPIPPLTYGDQPCVRQKKQGGWQGNEGNGILIN